MNYMESKKAVIFDLDGTLVDNEGLKGKALADTCRRHGGQCSSTIYQDVMGEKYEVVRSYFCEKAKVNLTDRQFDISFKEIYLDLLNRQVHLTDGVYDFLVKVRARGLRTAVVSSAQMWSVMTLLNKLGIDTFFDILITREDVTEHKPSPAAYLLALERLALRDRDVLVFEDSAAGLRAASAAGCAVVMIRHYYNARQDFSGALQEIRSFDEMTL